MTGFGSHPERDDVVVRPTRRGAALVFVLGTPSFPDQLWLATRQAAEVHAVCFARFAHVQAWFDDSGAQMTLLGDFRTRPRPSAFGLGARLVPF